MTSETQEHEIEAGFSHVEGPHLIYFWFCTCGAEGPAEWINSWVAIDAGEREHLA